MYRLLENTRPARKQQTPARAATKKWQTGGKSVEGAVETTIGRNCWEASDQRRDTKRHSQEWRFVRLHTR